MKAFNVIKSVKNIADIGKEAVARSIKTIIKGTGGAALLATLAACGGGGSTLDNTGNRVDNNNGGGTPPATASLFPKTSPERENPADLSLVDEGPVLSKIENIMKNSRYWAEKAHQANPGHSINHRLTNGQYTSVPFDTNARGIQANSYTLETGVDPTQKNSPFESHEVHQTLDEGGANYARVEIAAGPWSNGAENSKDNNPYAVYEGVYKHTFPNKENNQYHSCEIDLGAGSQLPGSDKAITLTRYGQPAAEVPSASPDSITQMKLDPALEKAALDCVNAIDEWIASIKTGKGAYLNQPYPSNQLVADMQEYYKK